MLNAEADIVHQMDLDSNFQVTAASAVDPHIALLSSDGRVGLLFFKETKAEGPRFHVSFPDINAVNQNFLQHLFHLN